ncbi:YdeI family protein [Aeromicrobium sp. CTD01-1L150]|uniref:YdeI/OmpD-associated family protein n=1 Tax=Aeromicrobium sp. CTD01-1L150 TaxID=3341830 RepID=UPI0035C12611
MSKLEDAERLELPSRPAWGAWLTEHHDHSTGAWLRIDDRSAPGEDALSYENAVLEALCWGWIDGQTRTEGPASLIWFSPRRRGSPWAASNKARLELLAAQGRMQPAGIALVEAAKVDGSWTVLDGPEAGIEPPGLTEALDAAPPARSFWDALPPSARKYALTQVATAKRPATRASRIERIVQRCAAEERPDR